MSEYRPDGWVIIEATLNETDEPEYFVFGSWSGGYLDGDSWRINSGISKMEEEDDHILFYGFSGSAYRCSKHGENRISAYNGSVLNTALEIHAKRGAKIVKYEDIKNQGRWQNGYAPDS